MRRGLIVLLLIFFVAPVYADEPTATPNPYSLSGFIYNDLNLNGARDNGEPGLSGISVAIDGPVSMTTGSSSDGYYLFLNLTNGAYSVRPDFGPGYTASSPVPATIVINSSGMTVDFGGRPALPTATATSTPTNTPIPPSPTATATTTSTPTNTPTSTPVATTPTATPTLASTAIPASGGCSLSAGPERDSMGSAFTFVGAGFPKGSNVALGLVLPDGAVEGLPAQQANNAGSIGFSYTTQAGDQTGLYTMIAEGGPCRVSAAFYVDDLPTPTPVKVVVQPGNGSAGAAAALTVAQPVATETPSPTPMPLLVSSDPLLRGVELMEADLSLATKAKTQPALVQTNVQTNTLPGGAGAGGWRIAITSNNISTNQSNPETKKENNNPMIWLLSLAGLAAGAIAITLKPFRKLFVLLVVVMTAINVPVVTQAQQGTPGKGTSRIEGLVINADTNSPPEGTLAIKIMVNGWLPIYSGKGGEWNITGLGAGDYEVELVELPAGYNPAQAKQVVHLSGVDEVVKMDLKYYTGPAITNTITMTSTTAVTRVVVLGVTTKTVISPTTSVSTTASVTSAKTISATTGITNALPPLPAVAGGGAMFATPVKNQTAIVPLFVISAIVVAVIIFLSRRVAIKNQ